MNRQTIFPYFFCYRKDPCCYLLPMWTVKVLRQTRGSAKGTDILVWLKEIKNKNVRNTTVNTNTNVPHPTTLKKDSILSHSEFAVCKISISMQSVYWCKKGPSFVFTPQWMSEVSRVEVKSDCVTRIRMPCREMGIFKI